MPAVTRIRRTIFLFLYFSDGTFFDIGALLTGKAAIGKVRQIYALSILAGQEYPIYPEDVNTLLSIPSDAWVQLDHLEPGVGASLIDEFASRGFILTDSADEALAELTRRDNVLSSSDWNVYAALLHFMTKWRDVRAVRLDLPEQPDKWPDAMLISEPGLRAYVDRFGPPPPEFHSVPIHCGLVELPAPTMTGGLYELLLARKTSRAFDTSVPLKLHELSTILYYVWGCQGCLPLLDGIVALKKTSPSGGSLHPIEVYTVLINVEGIEPGLYHYGVQHHALELIARLGPKEASALADKFATYQSYPRWSQALFVMTARFYRNYWKYRKHPKTYSVILMDAGHLSQTFYLVCAELGLGSFVTAAINSANIEEALGIDGFAEGAILICGCGHRAANDALAPNFVPYVPWANRSNTEES